MESKVIFRDNQELQAADFNNLQSHADDALSHVVEDAISSGLRYSGGAVAATSATEVSVAPLRFYNGGLVYASDLAQSMNLFQYLPVAAKKVVAVVVWGEEVETAIEPRDYLIDLATGATEPRAVAMRKDRLAQVNLLPGAESADPQPPVVQSGNLAIAYVVLTPAGIERVDQQTGVLLPQLEDHEERVVGLETWRGQAEPRISSIATDLSALARKTDDLAPRGNLIEMALDLARVKEKLRLPATYASYDADYFGDDAKSDPAAVGFAARLDNGLLFPFAASAQASLALFNPYDAAIRRHTDDLVLPAYDSVARIQTRGYSGDLSISQYQVQSHSLKSFQRTVWSYFYGPNWNYYAPWYNRWYWAYYGRTWGWMSYYGYWVSHQETAYEIVDVTTSVSGAIVAQSVLVPNAMWLTRVGLFFTQVASTGDVHLVLCETEGGKPVLTKSLAHVTVAPGSLSKYPAETVIDVPPVLLEAGKRYAIAVITQGDHRLATVSGNDYTQGTLFFGTDGDYFTGDLTRDLMFTFYGAQFRQPRVEVQLQPVSLAGGITDLGISAAQVVPKGCEIRYEVQVGGRWYALGDATMVLSAAPDLVPLRAVLLGTSDLAPGLVLAANAITASRPATAMVHISALRTLGASSTQITVEAVAAAYDPAHHTLACELISGANTYTPSVTATEDEPGGGAKRFIWTFSIPGGVSSYKIRLTGGRDATAPFSVTERVDVAS